MKQHRSQEIKISDLGKVSVPPVSRRGDRLKISMAVMPGQYRIFRLTLLTAVFLLVASGQTPAPSRSDPLGRSTPYGSVVGFLRAAAEDDYTRAAQYIDVRGPVTPDEYSLQQLDRVLNQGLSADLNKLDRSPEGNLADGLPPDRERVGSVMGPSGPIQIDLVRIQRKDASSIWLFPGDTFRKIENVDVEAKESFPSRYFPRPMVEIHFLSIPLWRWIAWAVEIALALLLTSAATRALIPVLRPIIRRFTHEQNETRYLKLKGPVRLLLLAGGFEACSAIATSLIGRKLWSDLSFAAAVLGGTWLVAQFASVTVQLHVSQLVVAHDTGKVAFLGLFQRLFNILLVLIAISLLLGRAGVNLTAVLAGLGVGGVALALAAQKTLENLFGGINLVSRDIVRPGDFCTLAGQTGTVLDVGLGSTRIRTLDRTVVSVSNAELAQKNIENISCRDKFWFHQVFGLRFDTTPEQMRTILTGIEGLLAQDAEIESQSYRVRFVGFAESSLRLEIFAYILSSSYEAFLIVQQRILLSIVETISAAGASIASPTVIADRRAVPDGHPADGSGTKRSPQQTGHAGT